MTASIAADRAAAEGAARALATSDADRALRLEALSASGFPAVPARDSESWRKIDLSGLDLNAFAYADSESVMEMAGALPEGVTLDETVGVRSARARLGLSGEPVFGGLGIALASQSIGVNVAGRVAEPLLVRHRLPRGDALVHRLSVHIAPGAEVTIVEDLSDEDNTAGEGFRFWNTLTDLSIAANARVNYIVLRQLGAGEYHFHDLRAELARDARLFSFGLQLGGSCGKDRVRADLNEPGAEYRGTGVAAGMGREYNELEMHAVHHAEHTQSSILYKAVVGDRAHNVFNGNLSIDANVKQVSSHQVNNNLLLNRRARAESMPNLVIHAEQVQCEHGATVGELEDEGLFFLMSRGIPEDEARKLLIEGFVAEVVREIPLAERHEEINLAVKRRLAL